ncbi:hypothetical protein ABFG95_06945 [Achromobacter sp. HNDS-1]|uniref:Uncharacterized protein n=1 Tax=Achromobacter sp. HNDS-1 TaxID=3151598 RepID=A0AAU7LEF6_9BURK
MRGMLIGAGLGLLGVIVGFVFASKTDVSAEAKWWDLMTAFGTVGTVVWAVWSSLRIEARQRREAVNRAKLAAVSMFAKLSSGRAFVESHRNIWAESECSALGIDDYRSKCREQFRAVVNSVAREEVLALVVAPGRCAELLTRGLASLELLVETLAFQVTPEKFPSTLRLLETVAKDFVAVRAICGQAEHWR